MLSNQTLKKTTNLKHIWHPNKEKKFRNPLLPHLDVEIAAEKLRLFVTKSARCNPVPRWYLNLAVTQLVQCLKKSIKHKIPWRMHIDQLYTFPGLKEFQICILSVIGRLVSLLYDIQSYRKKAQLAILS